MFADSSLNLCRAIGEFLYRLSSRLLLLLAMSAGRSIGFPSPLFLLWPFCASRPRPSTPRLSPSPPPSLSFLPLLSFRQSSFASIWFSEESLSLSLSLLPFLPPSLSLFLSNSTSIGSAVVELSGAARGGVLLAFLSACFALTFGSGRVGVGRPDFVILFVSWT